MTVEVSIFPTSLTKYTSGYTLFYQAVQQEGICYMNDNKSHKSLFAQGGRRLTGSANPFGSRLILMEPVTELTIRYSIALLPYCTTT